MAEILGVIASLGAIINIIDGTSKAISALNELRAQRRDADLTLLSLSAQLTTFKAALRRIHEWLAGEPPQSHHQLVMDLDEAFVSCGELIGRLEALLVEWKSTMDRPIATSSRWKVVFGRRGLDNLLVLVGHQTTALNLLLTACNCKTSAEQKQLLERPKSRRVLQRAKVGSASLLSQRDTASSVRTSWTGNLSKWSLVFDFDTDLFSSSVYSRARDLSKYRIRLHEERGWPMLKREESASGPLDDIQPDVSMEACSTHQSYASAQEYLEPPRTLAADAPLFQDDWEIVEMAVNRMLGDCARFTLTMAKHVPKIQGKHKLPSSLSLLPREASLYLPQVQRLWKHQDFGRLLQSVLTGGYYTTRQNGPNPETIAQLFLHQLKAVGGGRLPDQVSACIRSLESAYAHSKVLHSTEEGSSMTLRAFLTWSKGPVKLEEIWSNLPFPRNTHIDIKILTVAVSVRMRNHLHIHPIPELAGLMDDRLNSWVDTAKARKPDKIVLLLLVEGMEYFLPWVVDDSVSAVQDKEVQEVYTQVMEVLRLFGGIPTSLPNEYLMVWDSPQFCEQLLGSLTERFPPSERMKRHDTLVSIRE